MSLRSSAHTSKLIKWPYSQTSHSELPGVLWAYQTTSRWPTKTTPFAFAYEMEAIIPTEIGMPIAKIAVQDKWTMS